MATADSDPPRIDVPEPPAEGGAPGGHHHGELLRDILRYFPGVILPRLTGFVSVPIVTHLFPPETYGTYALVLANVTALSAVSLSGVCIAVMRFLPAYAKDTEAEDQLLSTVFTLAAVISIVVALAVLLVLLVTGRYTRPFGTMMIFGLFLFLGTNLLNLMAVILRSQRRAGVYSALQILSGYGGLAAGLALIFWLGFGITGLIIGNAIAAPIGVFIAWRVALRGRRIALNVFSRRMMAEVMRFSLFISLGNAAYWLLSLSDRWLLRVMRGVEEVGLYSVSYDLTSKTTMLFVTAFGLALQPLSVTAWETHGRNATETFLASSTRTYLLLMLPATVGLSLLGHALVGLMTASEYQPGAVVVPFVAAAMFMFGLLDIAGRGLTLNKRPDIEARNFLFAGLVSVGLNLVLIPRMGFLGAAITSCVGYFALLLLNAHSVQRHVRWAFPWKSLARCGLACAVMSAVVLLVKGAFATGPRGLDVAAAGLAGAVAYGALVFAMGEVSRDQIRRLLGLLKPQRSGEAGR